MHPSRRPLRVLASGIVILGLLLTSVAPVLAHGIRLRVDILSSPVQVTRGEPISYVVELKNTGFTSLDPVTLKATTPPGFIWRQGLTTQGSCNAAPAPHPSCSLGKLKPGYSAEVVLIFDTAPTAPLGSFEFAVTGQGKPPWGHLVTVVDKALTTVLAPNPNFVTQYIPPAGDTITTGGVTGGSALSATNPQGTAVVVPGTPFGVPASVGESGGPNDHCPPAFIGRCFGQTSEVLVGNGVVLNPYLMVQVRFDKSEIPWWLWFKLHKISVIHWFDPFPTAGFEEITAKCSDATPAQSELPCRLPVQVMPDHDLLITVFMESNGRVKGKG
jgi:hypothetical protein